MSQWQQVKLPHLSWKAEWRLRWQQRPKSGRSASWFQYLFRWTHNTFRKYLLYIYWLTFAEHVIFTFGIKTCRLSGLPIMSSPWTLSEELITSRLYTSYTLLITVVKLPISLGQMVVEIHKGSTLTFVTHIVPRVKNKVEHMKNYSLSRFSKKYNKLEWHSVESIPRSNRLLNSITLHQMTDSDISPLVCFSSSRIFPGRLIKKYQETPNLRIKNVHVPLCGSIPKCNEFSLGPASYQHGFYSNPFWRNPADKQTIICSRIKILIQLDFL